MLTRLSDRWFFGGLAAIALTMIVLAALWPQGIGTRSPPPFGHKVVIPDYVRIDEKKAKTRRDILRAAEAAQKASTGGIQTPDALPAEKAQ